MKLLAAAAARVKATNIPAFVCFGAGAMGALCLLASFHFHWFQLPALPVTGQAGLAPRMIGIETHCTRYWRIGIVLAMAFSAFAARSLPSQRRSICCMMLSAGTAALLFYPCSLLYFAPADAARANWLQTQHHYLTWLGGDIFSSSEIKNQDWKFNVTIVDLPREVGAVKIPKSLPWLLDIGRMGELAGWFGYSDAFCYFVCKGWVLAIAGSLLLLAVTMRDGGQLDYAQLRRALKAFTAVAATLCVTAVLPVFFTAFAVGRAHKAIQTGDYAASGDWLDRAGTVTPIIRENSFFIIQRGLIDDKLNRPTLQAEYFGGMRLENGGFYSEAEMTFSHLRDSAPVDSAIQREIQRGLLRAAIRDLNTGQTGRGATLLETILHSDPANLKVNYCLQLAYLRTHRLSELQEMIDSMRQVYGFVGTITKQPALAFCQENEALLRFLKGDLEGTLEDRRKDP